MEDNELLSQMLGALQHNDANALISLLASSPTTQRQAIMSTEFPEYPGISPFMALVAMVGTLGIGPLNALIKDVQASYLFSGMMDSYPAIRQNEIELSRILAGHRGKDVIDIIVDTMDTEDNTIRNALINNYSSEGDQHKITKLIENRVKERQALKKEQEEALAQQKAESIESTPQPERNYALDEIIELLSGQDLYEHNKINIDQLSEYPNFASDNADCSSIYMGLNYLKKIDLLNQETVAAVIKIIQTPGTSIYSYETAPAFNSDAFRLLGQLGYRYEIVIDKPELDIIFSMKKKNLERLSDVLSQLYNAKLLDKSSLSKAIEKTNDKIPIAEPAQAEKIGRNKATSQRSEIKLGNQGLSIFPEPAIRESKSSLPKNQIAGSSGVIKKAYAEGNPTGVNENPVYAVKKPLAKNITTRETKEMKREARYYNLLNQPAYYFLKNNKPRLATGWLKGKTVHQFDANELKTIPFENRLQWLSSGLSDLNKLHSHFRVHGDVSENNFMVNPQDNSMRLFDFGTAHKMGSSTGALTNTPLYTDPSGGGSDFQKDVYAVGVLCARLFPELYSVNRDGNIAKIEVIKAGLSPAEKAIVNFVDSLTSLDRNKRPTSEDAFNFCNKILAFKDNLGALTEESVKEITDSTINRTNFTSEDVFRGRSL